MTYLFGDSERAAYRLGLLARVFRPATVSFLEAWQEGNDLHAAGADAEVVDLGCGPGFTSRLLADRLDVAVTGLDSSEAFLWEARRLGPARLRFLLHDVTRTPFPTRPADLLFARLLLAHLAGVDELLAAWGSQLAPAGWMLLEEVAGIDTEEPTFASYLGLVAEGLRDRGSELYIGEHLGDLARDSGLRADFDRVHPFRVRDRDAATLFALNLPTLRESEEVRNRHSEAEIDAIQRRLDEIAHDLRDDSHIEWRLRQIGLRME